MDKFTMKMKNANLIHSPEWCRKKSHKYIFTLHLYLTETDFLIKRFLPDFQSEKCVFKKKKLLKTVQRTHVTKEKSTIEINEKIIRTKHPCFDENADY